MVNAYTLVLGEAGGGSRAGRRGGRHGGTTFGASPRRAGRDQRPRRCRRRADIHGVARGRKSRPKTSAAAVERLLNARAIILGKTNSPEFGHKGVTDNLRFGPTSTPWKIGYNSGGSSGGSAAAVADGMAALGRGPMAAARCGSQPLSAAPLDLNLPSAVCHR